MARLREQAVGHSRLIYLCRKCAVKRSPTDWVQAVYVQAFVGGCAVGQSVVAVVDGDWLVAMRRAKQNATRFWEERRWRRYESQQGLYRGRLCILQN